MVVSPAVARRDVMGRTTAGFLVVLGTAAVAMGVAMPAPWSQRLVILGGGVVSVVVGSRSLFYVPACPPSGTWWWLRRRWAG